MNKQAVSQGLNPPEGKSTCEGYDLQKHRKYPTSQTVESTYAGRIVETSDEGVDFDALAALPKAHHSVYEPNPNGLFGF